jgi:hypothetical protein
VSLSEMKVLNDLDLNYNFSFVSVSSALPCFLTQWISNLLS